MTWRGLLIPLVCAAAFAQLPRSQAPMPREGSSTPGRIDASITDPEGRPIADLKAADFTLEMGGKPQKIESAKFENDQPLRLAVVIDDLSLPAERLNTARRALREFVTKGMRDGDELAILRTGSGSGALDGFTSDKAALELSIDRARFNPESEEPTPESFAAGALNVLRGAVDGIREIPGRKALLFISERIGDKQRTPGGASDNQLVRLAHRASTVLYAFDSAPSAQPALDLGLAAWAKETGGRVFDSGDLAAALARIAQEQRSYYVVTFGSDELGFDYLARAPKVESVTLRTARQDAVVRARNGYFGPGDEPPGADVQDAESDRLENGIRARLTALFSNAGNWQIEVAVHVDAHDITFVKGTDGVYRTRIETATTLLDDQGKSTGDAPRTFQAQLPESTFDRFLTHGLDYTVVIPVPREGSYLVRSVVRDAVSGRMGSTRRFLRARDWKDGKLVMSSIVMRGEMAADATGALAAADPLESGAVRSFKAGHKVTYAYNLFNVASDAEKRSEVDTRSELWRDGVRIYNAEPRPIAFPAEANPGRRSITGSIMISDSMPPGGYILRITVTDKLSKRAASQWMDFEVRP